MGTKIELTHQDKITDAFYVLENLGYFVAQDFWCCQNCAWNALTDEQALKAVFYHRQDADSLDADGNLKEYMYLAWAGDPIEIRKVLEANGLKVEHNGEQDDRIKLLP